MTPDPNHTPDMRHGMDPARDPMYAEVFRAYDVEADPVLRIPRLGIFGAAPATDALPPEVEADLTIAQRIYGCSDPRTCTYHRDLHEASDRLRTYLCAQAERVRRLEEERIALISAKRITIAAPPMPESELVGILRQTINEKNAEIARLRAQAERVRGLASRERAAKIEALEWLLVMDAKSRSGLGNAGSWRKMAKAEIARLRKEREQA